MSEDRLLVGNLLDLPNQLGKPIEQFTDKEPFDLYIALAMNGFLEGQETEGTLMFKPKGAQSCLHGFQYDVKMLEYLTLQYIFEKKYGASTNSSQDSPEDALGEAIEWIAYETENACIRLSKNIRGVTVAAEWKK